MAKKTDVLGKGLGALLEEAEQDYSDKESKGAKKSAAKSALPKGITQDGADLFADLSLLQPNPQQPRTEFDEDALQELAASIKENGIIQPVLIEEAGGGKFYIIAGERRCRAAKLAGLDKVPVRLKKYSEERKLEVALIENIQRENLNPVEEAIAYKRLMELSGIGQEEVASRVGKNRSTVANALRLLKLPEDMQSALANGTISAGHARAILSVANSSDQRILFGKIVGSALSVRDAESQAAELNGGGKVATKKSDNKKAKTAAKKSPDLDAIEQKFIEALGTKVVIKGDLNKGSLQIDYYSADDLDRLYNIIVDETA